MESLHIIIHHRHHHHPVGWVEQCHSASSIIYQQTAVKLGALRHVKVKEDSSPKTDHVIIVFTTISYMYFTQHHFKIVNLCVGITLGSNLLISNLDLYYIFNPFHSIAMNVIIIVQAISYFRRCSRTDFIHQVHHHVDRHNHGHDRSYR